MILSKTIQERLSKAKGESISYIFDIRYLQRWINEFPSCFPKYVLDNNYTCYFNPDKYRWEILRGKRDIKFNPNNYS